MPAGDRAIRVPMDLRVVVRMQVDVSCRNDKSSGVKGTPRRCYKGDRFGDLTSLIQTSA
jgi:hypothetical protein